MSNLNTAKDAEISFNENGSNHAIDLNKDLAGKCVSPPPTPPRPVNTNATLL